MVKLTLRQEDAHLAYLAIAFHIGRPGSELDPITKRQVEHGLAEVARELQPQLRLAAATLSLNDVQATRLLSAMLGSITELKAYPMFEPRLDEAGGGRRSSVAGFDRSLFHLFPAVESDATEAIDVAERMLMLKRRLDDTLTQSNSGEPASRDKKRRWWPFGR